MGRGANFKANHGKPQPLDAKLGSLRRSGLRLLIRCQETMSTLRYANRAKAIKVSATKNEEASQAGTWLPVSEHRVYHGYSINFFIGTFWKNSACSTTNGLNGPPFSEPNLCKKQSCTA